MELRSNGAGELQSLLLNQRVLANFADLRREIAYCVHADDANAGELEVEIASDPDLRYEFMIAAITAVSGERNREGKLVPLIERIKFAPPRP